MNFLELCREAAPRCNVTGTIGAVAQQTGPQGALVRAINEAWLHIQQESNDWKWMRDRFSMVTTPGLAVYPMATVLGTNAVKIKKFRTNDRQIRCFKTELGRTDAQVLAEQAYPNYEAAYLYAASSPGRPTVFAIDDTKALCLGVTPDAVGYTVEGWYQREPSLLVDNTDTPIIPGEFHLLIVYRAMMIFGAADNAPEVFSTGKALYDPMLSRMRMTEEEMPTWGAPLA